MRKLFGLLGAMAGMFLANSLVSAFSFEVNYGLTLCLGGLIGALLLDHHLPINSPKFLAILWYPVSATALLFSLSMIFVLSILLFLSLAGDLSLVNDESLAIYLLFVLSGGAGSGLGFLLFTFPFGIKVKQSKFKPLKPTPEEFRTRSGDF